MTGGVQAARTDASLIAERLLASDCDPLAYRAAAPAPVARVTLELMYMHEAMMLQQDSTSRAAEL